MIKEQSEIERKGNKEDSEREREIEHCYIEIDPLLPFFSITHSSTLNSPNSQMKAKNEI